MVSLDLTISLDDIISKTSDEVKGHHYHKMDDNNYIKQELKSFYIIAFLCRILIMGNVCITMLQ